MEQQIWIVRCARRLRQHWPHLPTGQLEESASDLAQDPALREQEPEKGAEAWLRLGVLVA